MENENIDVPIGLSRLKILVKGNAGDALVTVATLEARWLSNSNSARTLGGSEDTRRESAQIIRALNELALQLFDTTFNVLCRDEAKFNALCQAKEEPRTQFVFEVIKPSNFDLIVQVNIAMEQTRFKQKGVFGFAMPCGDNVFLEHFCARLAYELGEVRKTRALGSLLINRAWTRQNEAFNRFKQLHLFAAKNSDVVFALQPITDMKVVFDFWDCLIKSDDVASLTNRLMVVLPLNLDSPIAIPDSVLNLQRPTFSYFDALTWVKTIVRALGYPHHFISEWVDAICQECFLAEAERSQYDTSLMYDHIQWVMEVLLTHPTSESFLLAIKDRRLQCTRI